MHEPTWHFGRPPIPTRAVVISVAALAVPVLTRVLDLGDPDAQPLVWLLALVPAFLLAYYRGWRGVATAIAGGMVALVATNLGLAVAGTRLSASLGLLAGVVAFLAVSLGIGFLSDLLHQARAQAERLALTDDLTGLANRRYARLALEREFAAAQRGRPLTVAIFDLDRFKAFNDQRGHRAGDAALQAFATVLATRTRQMDLSARYGGEEFLTILSSCGTSGGAAFGARVRALLATHPDNLHGITVSVGIAAYSPEIGSADELLAAADEAMYAAKRNGRDRVEVSVREPTSGTAPGDPPRSADARTGPPAR